MQGDHQQPMNGNLNTMDSNNNNNRFMVLSGSMGGNQNQQSMNQNGQNMNQNGQNMNVDMGQNMNMGQNQNFD